MLVDLIPSSSQAKLLPFSSLGVHTFPEPELPCCFAGRASFCLQPTCPILPNASGLLFVSELAVLNESEPQKCKLAALLSNWVPGIKQLGNTEIIWLGGKSVDLPSGWEGDTAPF